MPTWNTNVKRWSLQESYLDANLKPWYKVPKILTEEYFIQNQYSHSCELGYTLRWRHNGGDSVSNHQPHHRLLNRSFRRRSKKTSKLRVTGLCVGNSPGTSEFPAQMASNVENVSIWWRHVNHCHHFSAIRLSIDFKMNCITFNGDSL